MIDRLIQNHKNVEDIYENKKQNHMDTIEEKYKEWTITILKRKKVYNLIKINGLLSCYYCLNLLTQI